MTENNQNEGDNHIFVLRPDRHAVVRVSCNRPEYIRLRPTFARTD